MNSDTNFVSERESCGLDRRSFLGAVGLGVGAATVAAVGASHPGALAFADDAPIKEEWNGRKAILFDGSKCIGCHYCEAGCKKAHGLTCEVDLNLAALVDTVYPKEALPIEAIRGMGEAKAVKADDRDATRWLRVVQVTGTPMGEEGDDGFMRHSCTHCGLCAQVCPARALVRREDGIVEVHSDRCIGCKYCYQACPFDVPRFATEGEDRAMHKCDMCAERIDRGEVPACVQSCPAGALASGTLAEMVVAGREAVARLQDAGYDSAYLYGEQELGGIGVLFVMPYGADAYSFPKV